MDSTQYYHELMVKSLGENVPEEWDRAIEYCHLMAGQGNADAQWILGRYYYSGLAEIYDACADKETSAGWFEKAAALGHIQAQIDLGDMLYKGDGLARDTAAAVALYHNAAEQGSAEAQYILGKHYDNNVTRDALRDIPQAIQWFEKAAAQNHDMALYALGLLYEDDEKGPHDTDKGIAYYFKAAETENPDAQCKLGELYSKGRGVPEDREQALSWLLKAANNGSSSARLMYECMLHGDSVGSGAYGPRVDKSNRIQLSSGYIEKEAKYKMGELYRQGRGVPKDEEKAKAWFEKAAASGSREAKKALGIPDDEYNYTLEGLEEDKSAFSNEETWDCYRTAMQGQMIAENNIGYAYQHGEGVKQDYAKAFRWYNIAAIHGSDASMRHLGELYKGGLGVAQDIAQAKGWLEKAAAKGDSKAKQMLSEINSN